MLKPTCVHESIPNDYQAVQGNDRRNAIFAGGAEDRNRWFGDGWSKRFRLGIFNVRTVTVNSEMHRREERRNYTWLRTWPTLIAEIRGRRSLRGSRIGRDRTTRARAKSQGWTRAVPRTGSRVLSAYGANPSATGRGRSRPPGSAYAKWTKNTIARVHYTGKTPYTLSIVRIPTYADAFSTPRRLVVNALHIGSLALAFGTIRCDQLPFFRSNTILFNRPDTVQRVRVMRTVLGVLVSFWFFYNTR